MEKIEYFENISSYSREYSENIDNYSIKSKRYLDSNLISKKKIIHKLNKNKIGRDSGGENCNFSKIILGVPEKKALFLKQLLPSSVDKGRPLFF